MVFRLSAIVLVGAIGLRAQFLELTIGFEGTDCLSCAESLEPRLARVRGVERVELDLTASTVRLTLAPDNKVRLGPLLARITQDGTKVVSLRALCRGSIVEADGERRLQPGGLDETYPILAAEPPPAGVAGVAEGAIDGGRFRLENWRPDSPER